MSRAFPIESSARFGEVGTSGAVISHSPSGTRILVLANKGTCAKMERMTNYCERYGGDASRVTNGYGA
ncbi:hypothetical protein [Glycomyces sp. L485]|uniref:hypothetical protein n=1 Tax=Glycomyces sp. L485 TaxID=2909235 RepID=UPI001F4BB11B|nr:hypothetical protein [Glycomyces sp. L485]